MTPETTYLAILGQILTQKRKNKGWDQTKVATETGINRSSWSRLENGETAPDAIQLQKIAEVFNTTPGKFLEEVDEVSQKMKELNIKVHTEKKKPNANKLGWFVLGTALGAAVTAILSDKNSPKNTKNKQ